MELNIEIVTNDRMFAFELFDSKTLAAGETEKAITEGVSIQWKGKQIRETFGYPEIIRAALDFGEKVVLPIVAPLIAKWLYDKLKGRANRIIIETTVVEIDEGKIKKVITQKIQKKLEEK